VWIASELQAQLESENERVRAEQAKAVANKVQAAQLVGAAGIAFLVFIFFTLMLVLMAIERNTRPIGPVARQEPAATPLAA
jgi:hypothetical protein